MFLAPATSADQTSACVNAAQHYYRPSETWPSGAGATSNYRLANFWDIAVEHKINDFIAPRENSTSTAIRTVRNWFLLVINHNGADLLLDGNRALESVLSHEQITTASDAVIIAPFETKLSRIQEQYGLSVTQLAEAFQVTRKSVYDWLDGKATPRANILEKTEILLEIASREKNLSNLKQLKSVWSIQKNGKSLLSVMNDDSIGYNSRIEQFGSLLREFDDRLHAEASRPVAKKPLSRHIDLIRSADA